jgi:Mlc titration factor MtfA (ptsG expression regulator)
VSAPAARFSTADVLVVAGIFLVGLVAAFGPVLFRNRTLLRRRHLLRQPIPPGWTDHLSRDWHLFPRLPEPVREAVLRAVQVLRAEKRFEACGGLEEVTEEMKLLILAQAALLLVGRPEPEHLYYPDLVTILVYPGAYRDRGHRTFSLRDERLREDIRLGESWDSGSVVLAWDSVRAGAANAHDGVNVVFHEFAHQIDRQDGATDGTPELEDGGEYLHWSEVFRVRYEELLDQVERGRRPSRPLLDDYGASAPEEFFAVATEAFFERAARMDREMPDLYDELADFYGLDPASWDAPPC